MTLRLAWCSLATSAGVASTASTSYTSAGTAVLTLPFSCHCQVIAPRGCHHPIRDEPGPGTVAGGGAVVAAADGPADGTADVDGTPGSDGAAVSVAGGVTMGPAWSLSLLKADSMNAPSEMTMAAAA